MYGVGSELTLYIPDHELYMLTTWENNKLKLFVDNLRKVLHSRFKDMQIKSDNVRIVFWD